MGRGDSSSDDEAVEMQDRKEENPYAVEPDLEEPAEDMIKFGHSMKMKAEGLTSHHLHVKAKSRMVLRYATYTAMFIGGLLVWLGAAFVLWEHVQKEDIVVNTVYVVLLTGGFGFALVSFFLGCSQWDSHDLTLNTARNIIVHRVKRWGCCHSFDNRTLSAVSELAVLKWYEGVKKLPEGGKTYKHTFYQVVIRFDDEEDDLVPTNKCQSFEDMKQLRDILMRHIARTKSFRRREPSLRDKEIDVYVFDQK